MKQYHAAKREFPDCLLFFRLGDFFELFYQDAITASADLEITLTKRRNGRGDPIPMCGVPVHASESYLGKLLKKGHRVAICDQVEPPQAGKRLVKREIVRVLSPGTTSDVSMLKAGENNYVAAMVERGQAAGIAYADISTGEFRALEAHAGEARDILESLSVRELLLPDRPTLVPDPGSGPDLQEGEPYTQTRLESWAFDFEYGNRLLLDTFDLHNLEGLGIADRQLCISACGALVHYLRDTQRTSLPHLDRPTFVEQKDWMVLDPLTVRHLELFDPLYQETRTTLLFALDRTATAMGARLQRSWLLRPSMDRDEIEQRLEAVERLCGATIARSELRRELEPIYDIERLLARTTLGSAGPRDIYNLGISLRRIPTLQRYAAELPSRRIAAILRRLDGLEDICERILLTLATDPPATLADGSAIAEGFDSELDELRAIQRDSRGVIAAMERREREETGIDSLKVRFNNVFGFFIEVSKANLAKVPSRYDRKQTLVNSERYTTPELKRLEARVLDAEDRMAGRVAEIFEALCAEIASQAARIRRSAMAIAELDVLAALAHVAVKHDYVRPRFSDSGELAIEGGRHPVVERMLETLDGESFIENDVRLDSRDRLLAVITGPNMGGKSTYMRQIALIAVMAQSGSFVPARSAVLPLVDRVFTRIGASDSLATGRSTFMVEMIETAQILNLATERSLVLLDEIGRGTSTYDGLAIAWAVAEHILGAIGAKTLFATHYHELTALPGVVPGSFNLHVSAREDRGRLVFLRKVKEGSANRSYGIEVAKLAGLPPRVLRRAGQVLARHERDRRSPASPAAAASPGGGRAGGLSPRAAMAQELSRMDVDSITPLEAISVLHEWKDALEGR